MIKRLKTRIPRHVGVIAGRAEGHEAGLRVLARLGKAGVQELSLFGFTQDGVKRPAGEVTALRAACVTMAERLAAAGARVRAVGDSYSPAFPAGLEPFLAEPGPGPGPKVNLLVNYGWRWDVEALVGGRHRTAGIPPVDLIVRWGGGRRLSGFLPMQSVYADFYTVDAPWSEYEDSHVDEALAWYAAKWPKP